MAVVKAYRETADAILDFVVSVHVTAAELTVELSCPQLWIASIVRIHLHNRKQSILIPHLLSFMNVEELIF